MAKKFFDEVLKRTIELQATDLHLCVGSRPLVRINTRLRQLEEFDKVSSELSFEISKVLLDDRQFLILNRQSSVDISYSKQELGRFRCNFYNQRGTVAIAIRSLPHIIPDLVDLGLPDEIMNIINKRKGLILVTGVTGSGKSTTLASIIKYLNHSKSLHINTIEDPIEYMHKHEKSLVTQKEIGSDALDFKSALRASLREDPDVIMVGEMRDKETISISLTAAETGHLVLSTLHTSSAIQSIDRIIDTFTGSEQSQVRTQLATTLEGIISQQLMPDKSGNILTLAAEVLAITPAVRNLIRENKTYQISSILQSGLKDGMVSMERSLANLVRENIIEQDDAYHRAKDINLLKNYLRLK